MYRRGRYGVRWLVCTSRLSRTLAPAHHPPLSMQRWPCRASGTPSLGLNFPQLLVRKILRRVTFHTSWGFHLTLICLMLGLVIWVEAGICTQMGHLPISQDTSVHLLVNEKGPSRWGKSEGQLCQDAGSV